MEPDDVAEAIAATLPQSVVETTTTTDFTQLFTEDAWNSIKEDPLLSLWYREREPSPPRDPAAAAAAEAAAEAAALVTAIEAMSRRESERLQAVWAAAASAAEGRDLRHVSFHRCPAHGVRASGCGESCLEARALALAANASVYYIGTTTDPCWRWVGGPGRSGRGDMVGHRFRFERMAVIGVDHGRTAGRLEGLVIGRRLRSPRLPEFGGRLPGLPASLGGSVLVRRAHIAP